MHVLFKIKGFFLYEEYLMRTMTVVTDLQVVNGGTASYTSL